jgi:hypothetical protein
VPAGVIAVVEQCVTRVQMSWETFYVEPIPDRLQGGARKRYGISLCLVVNTNRISGLEGARGHSVFGSYKEAMLSSEICKLVAFYAQGEEAR